MCSHSAEVIGKPRFRWRPPLAGVSQRGNARPDMPRWIASADASSVSRGNGLGTTDWRVGRFQTAFHRCKGSRDAAVAHTSWQFQECTWMCQHW